MASHLRRPSRPLIVRAYAHQLRRVAAVLLGMLTGLAMAVTLAAVPAAAEPSISAVEKQIDDAWNKIEPIVERHNEIKQRLNAGRKKATKLKQQIEPLALQVDLAMDQVTAFAARRYEGGDMSALNALLQSGSPQTFTQQMEMLNQFAKRQRRQVQDVLELKGKFESQKAPLDRLVAQLEHDNDALAAQEKTINAQIAQLQKLRLKLYAGTDGGQGELRPAPCPVSYPGGKAGIAVKFACAQIGKMYVWGSAGPNTFDCSGLTMAAWAKAGVSLPHNARAQRRSVRSVSRSQLRVGDLVFYYSDTHHVGMYVGGGWIVHASRAGEPIKMKRVDDGPISGYGRPS